MNKDQASSDEIERRKQWFESYMDRLENHSTIEPVAEGVVYSCPCCKFFTLGERGGFEICPICFWEDDGQDEEDGDIIRGGPNKGLSLTQAQKNYLSFGACDKEFLRHVRPPKECEKTSKLLGYNQFSKQFLTNLSPPQIQTALRLCVSAVRKKKQQTQPSRTPRRCVPTENFADNAAGFRCIAAKAPPRNEVTPCSLFGEKLSACPISQKP